MTWRDAADHFRLAMFDAGLGWEEAMTLPLADSLSILETHLDRLMVERHRQAEIVWASIAPHSSKAIPAPEPPGMED